MSGKITRAMIFAAGLGTRLKPWTEKHPKALAPVNNKPLLRRNIEYLKAYGITDIIVNVHHFADQVTGFLAANNNFGIRIEISHEQGEPLETGGGLQKAAWFLQESDPFFVINADILTDMDIYKMQAFHEKHQPLVTLAITGRSSSRAFLFDENNRLCGWQNTQTGEEKKPVAAHSYKPGAFSGIHLMNPAIFPLLTEKGKFSLVDVYLRLAPDQLIMGYDHSGTKLVDVGKPEAIVKAEQLFP
ncbi:MAG: nucleotidyltransferase family protein [Chitinophagaceae bacterium]|nr:nucleotidyltransferase family protein [Chitinophagaceae bacterium]MCW5926089.1 nucleotidyltransferase family protein [Chitinophagaceae bacterium]